MKNNSLLIYSFYRFVFIKNKSSLKEQLDKYLIEYVVKGTILLADEGINGSISGKEDDLKKIINHLKKMLNIRKIEIKINQTDFLPFNKMKVRLKKEIVSLGQGNIDVIKYRGKLLNTIEWNKIIKNRSTNLIDVRNNFEIEIGTFKNAYNLKMESFRDFPKRFERLNLKKNSNIAMYCTGGIRCEKASAYLKKKGFKNVYQLKGGIIDYFKDNKNKKNLLWNGECFVFDQRVTITKNLVKGKYTQCYGCRRPLLKKDLKSKFYIKGVSCRFCHSKRTDQQKESSMSRQAQIEKRKASS